MFRLLILLAISSRAFSYSEFGVVLLGDTGTGNQNQYKVASAIKSFCQVERCDGGLLLGDNFYPEGVKNSSDPQFETKFHKPYDPLRMRWYVVLGNHDHQGSIDAQLHHSGRYWMMPGRYFAWSIGDVLLVGLDSNGSISAAMPWIKKTLAQSQHRWKFVFAHHPIYSYGEHGNTHHLKDLNQMMKDYKVDLYASGHDHDKQVILKDINDKHKIVYVVSGTGAKTRPTRWGEGTAWADSELGFVHASVYGKKLTISVIAASGELRFQYQSEKP